MTNVCDANQTRKLASAEAGSQLNDDQSSRISPANHRGAPVRLFDSLSGPQRGRENLNSVLSHQMSSHVISFVAGTDDRVRCPTPLSKALSKIDVEITFKQYKLRQTLTFGEARFLALVL
jgi:hypothetical protein